ncbi:MAG TPA: polysaccharide deacetylase family protein [Pyrinomonadaceae bacterium]
MSVLKAAKLLTLNVGKSMGLLHALRRSEWRKQQLLILAYHGVSIDDEHIWNSDLFLSPDQFRRRMQALKDYGCNVLSLPEALDKLWTRTLPDCSVVLTFDDGSADFYSRAFPILQEFGWPATVYLTSYYSNYNRPVFDVMCWYLLWKARGKTVNLEGLIDGETSFDLHSAPGWEGANQAIREYSRREKFSAAQKDQLLYRLAERLGVDYQAILTKRILHLLSPQELTELAQAGVDIQLHTHRHHAPKTRDSFLIELEENKNFITRFTKFPKHFAYPHGIYEPCYTPWLGDFEVLSATTCEPGLATKQTDPYKLPRLIDTSSLSLLELEGWISGFSKFLPRKPTKTGSDIPPHYY